MKGKNIELETIKAKKGNGKNSSVKQILYYIQAFTHKINMLAY